MLFKMSVLFLVPLSLYAMPGYFEPWGRDADLRTPTEEPLTPTPSLAARGMNLLIALRQNYLTATDGPRSHFQPTSSEYMRLAIEKHGFLKGYLMGCDRLMRENSEPWVYNKIEAEGKLFKHDPVR